MTYWHRKVTRRHYKEMRMIKGLMLTVMCLLSVLAMLMLLTNDQMARSASAGKHPYDTETEDYPYVDQEVRWVNVSPCTRHAKFTANQLLRGSEFFWNTQACFFENVQNVVIILLLSISMVNTSFFLFCYRRVKI